MLKIRLGTSDRLVRLIPEGNSSFELELIVGFYQTVFNAPIPRNVNDMTPCHPAPKVCSARSWVVNFCLESRVVLFGFLLLNWVQPYPFRI